MKKILKNTIKSVRIILVFLVMVSLCSDGIFAAQRLIDNCEEFDQIDTGQLDESQLRQGPPDPDQLPENMANSGSPNTEQYAYNSGRIILKVDNSESNQRYFQKDRLSACSKSTHSVKSDIVATTAMVNSDLGQQFTLVGAKPSGTS
ncbi:MAG: hypothetical protein DWP97_09645 [Calditrichaeota bacterium]|nr:MAG: hypothetical protein DWP97_09645 [Calditrichota bacterium]